MTRGSVFSVAGRVMLFAALAFLAMRILAVIIFMVGANLLLVSALSVFLGAAAANWVAMRIYEDGRLTQIGFDWNAAAVRNLLLGLAGGAGAAILVIGGPLAVRAAELQPVPGTQADWAAILFLIVVLLFGAVGEEMLFRGFGFQVLMASVGPLGAILPVGALFALAHLGNLSVSWLALLNTFSWGVLLGYAFWRSGDLWLPIGLHVSWNWALPLLGTNLSGFTMNVTGYSVHWNVPTLWSGGDYGPEGGILTSAILIALAVFLWKAPVIRQRPLLLGTREET
jgi:uncharacterized protein